MRVEGIQDDIDPECAAAVGPIIHLTVRAGAPLVCKIKELIELDVDLDELQKERAQQKGRPLGKNQKKVMQQLQKWGEWREERYSWTFGNGAKDTKHILGTLVKRGLVSEDDGVYRLVEKESGE